MANNKKEFKRWYIIVGAVLIQMCLGCIYSWSVFTPELTLPLSEGGIYGFSASQAAWIFSTAALVLAVFIIVAGKILVITGPRKLAVISGAVLSLGYILAGLFGRSFFAQLFFIGLIGGIGAGLGYIIPIVVGIGWFPDKKGMVTGFAITGFGFGSMLWVKSAGSWFNLLNKLDFYGLGGVQSVFLLYGIIFFVVISLGSIVMVNPPADYVPKNWNPSLAANTTISRSTSGLVNFTPLEMMRTPQFYMIWFTFLFSAMSGMMVIYCIKLFGIDTLTAGGLTTTVASTVAGTAMGWYAIFNGFGRMGWGTISDKIGRKKSIILMCLLQGITMLLFFKMGGHRLTLIAGACMIGFNFGGNYTLFPSITADYFGNKNVGLNYGYVVIASGLAGVVGPQIAGYFKDTAQSNNDPSVWIAPFVIAGIACLSGALITMISKPPEKLKFDINPSPEPKFNV